MKMIVCISHQSYDLVSSREELYHKIILKDQSAPLGVVTRAFMLMHARAYKEINHRRSWWAIFSVDRIPNILFTFIKSEDDVIRIGGLGQLD